jgi:hypothetical protein
MKDRPYSYRDTLPAELEAVWERSRDAEDGDEPEMVVRGVGREALVVTPVRVYRLTSGTWPLGDGGERVAVRALADLVEARVRDGLFLCRMGLVFASGEELTLRVRVPERDKVRLVARMLATLSVEAREAAKEAAIARQARAQAEAAASRHERGGVRATALHALSTRGDAGTPAVGDGARGVATGGDVVELLRGLWQLVEVGALSADEFQAKKADLLGRV